MKRIARLGLIGAAALASDPAFARPGGSFVGMGDLPGGAFSSYAVDVSSDGAVVVGRGDMGLTNNVYQSVAVRWTRSLGIRPLTGVVGTGVDSIARAVSGNGQFIGGSGVNSFGEAFAFVWSHSLGLTSVGAPIDGLATRITVSGPSNDGSIAVGDATVANAQGLPTRAFRWIRGEGSHLLPGLENEEVCNESIRISTDGGIVIGSVHNGAGYFEGFRWSEESGLERLGQLSPNESLVPTAMSLDGEIIVGRTYSFIDGVFRERGFRWTLTDGLRPLPAPEDELSVTPHDISSDGALIVGRLGADAAVWVRNHEPVLLSDFISSRGVTGFDGWHLGGATGVSEDGNTIIGAGSNPQGNSEGFIVTLPPRCPGDADHDGAVTFADISAILTHWQGFGPQGDANDDFIVDFNDITETLTNWQGACP